MLCTFKKLLRKEKEKKKAAEEVEKPNFIFIRFSSKVFTSLALSLLLLKIAYLDWRLSSAVHSIPFYAVAF